MNSYFSSLNQFRKNVIETLKSIELTVLDEGIPHEQIIPNATYSPWLADVEFMEIYATIKNNTLVDIYRCYELWVLVKQLSHVEGDILEVGVWRGGTAAIIANAAKLNLNTKVFLCDTFSGVVKASIQDTNYKGGEHADTDEDIVKTILAPFNLTNAFLLKGIYPDDFINDFKTNRIKFCHIDVDTYASAQDILEYTWPNVVPGGMVVFDDFGFWGCEGITRYFNELELPGTYKIHNLNGHGILIKMK